MAGKVTRLNDHPLILILLDLARDVVKTSQDMERVGVGGLGQLEARARAALDTWETLEAFDAGRGDRAG